ncbi:MAG: flagellar export chaperone FliS [Desulfobacterota bacterium]|nr:flagellar export chaperone FliS [Thermodesulfobacteriota bacterium]MDW8002564.1 flagellar export chaperone FliS [Deltaproteobacteria bacterium]
MINFSRRVLSAYTDAEHVIDVEDKPKLLLKVYEEIIKKLDTVKKAIEKKDYEKKFTELSKIEQMIQILDESLDRSFGQISENLSSLYAYIMKNLRDVHVSLDLKKIDECKGLLCTIFDGFKKAYEIEQKKRNEKKVDYQDQRIVI